MSDSVNFEKYPTVVIVTLVVPTVINLLLFLIADMLGFIDKTVLNPATGEPFGLLEVAVLTFMPLLVAVILFYILGKRVGRPILYLRIIAILVYLAFFPGPIFIGAPLEMLVTLETMHIIPFAFVVGYLTTQAAS